MEELLEEGEITEAIALFPTKRYFNFVFLRIFRHGFRRFSDFFGGIFGGNMCVESAPKW